MGCSFCKSNKQIIKVQISNVSKPNLESNYYNNNLRSFVNDKDNNSKDIVYVKNIDSVEYTKSHLKSSSKVLDGNREESLIKKLSSKINNNAKVHGNPSIKDLNKSNSNNNRISSHVFINEKSSLISSSEYDDYSNNKGHTYKVIQNNNEKINIFIYCIGLKSEIFTECLTRNLMNHNLLKERNSNNNQEIDSSLINSKKFLTSLFEVSKDGLKLLDSLKDKNKFALSPFPENKDSYENINESAVLYEALPNVDLIKKNLHGSIPKKKAFYTAKDYYVYFCSLFNNNNFNTNLFESIDAQIQQSNNSINFSKNINNSSIKHGNSNNKTLVRGILLFAFDFSDQKSFDYIIDSLKELKTKQYKSTVVGIKRNKKSSHMNLNKNDKIDANTGNLILDGNKRKVNESNSNESLTFEVNEDFAKIAFKNLDVEFYIINEDEYVLEDKKKLKSKLNSYNVIQLNRVNIENTDVVDVANNKYSRNNNMYNSNKIVMKENEFSLEYNNNHNKESTKISPEIKLFYSFFLLNDKE